MNVPKELDDWRCLGSIRGIMGLYNLCFLTGLDHVTVDFRWGCWDAISGMKIDMVGQIIDDMKERKGG